MAGAFAIWCESAKVAERCAAVDALTDEIGANSTQYARVADCEKALRYLAADPSPKVRARIAERLAERDLGLAALIRLLCDDVDSVALPLVRTSTAIDEAALVDLAATGTPRVRHAVASRSRVSPRVSAALAQVGDRDAVCALLRNERAAITPAALWTIARRFADDGAVRDLLGRRADLPPEIRQRLVLEVGQSLMSMGLVRNALGPDAASRVCAEACESGMMSVTERLEGQPMIAFIDHLRATGQITTAFLLRAVCSGRVDLFAAALSCLSGRSFARVRSVLVDAREPSFTALCLSAGLAREVTALLLAATQSWKAVAHTRTAENGAGETTAKVLNGLVERLRGEPQTQASFVLQQTLARLIAQTGRSALTQPRQTRRPMAA